MIWRVVQRNVWSDIMSWRTRRLSNSTKYLLHASMTTTSKKKKRNLLESCQKYALKLFWKCLYLARIGRPDILWSVNKLARSITKWTKACDKRLNRLISYIHHTCEYKQYCYVANKHCQTMQIRTVSRLRFCRRSRRLNINIKWTLVHFRNSHVRANKLNLQRNRLQFSHSSTEAEIISLDADLRMDGIPALDLWDIWFWKCSFLPETHSTTPKVKYNETCRVTPHQTSTPKTKPRFQPSTTILIWTMLIVCRRTRSLLDLVRCCLFFEENEAVSKNDHQRQKSHNETCIQNPQSCSGLVVWQD